MHRVLTRPLARGGTGSGPAFEEEDRGMVQEDGPDAVLLPDLLRREAWPVPGDRAEPCRSQRLLVGLDAEVIVLDPYRAVVQVEGPGERRPLADLAVGAHLEAISPVRRES